MELWSPEKFSGYLSTYQTLNKPFLKGESFPEFIDLSQSTHGVLNGLRNATLEDGRERGALLGFNHRQRNLQAGPFIIGERGSVDPQPLFQHARRSGINAIGGVHSHPTNYYAKFLPFINLDFSHFAQFSATDLLCLILSPKSDAFLGLVDGKRNLFAFKTSETPSQIPHQNILSRPAFFEFFWYSKLLDPLTASRWYHDPLTINRAIAREYKIAIYSGEANQTLERVSPPNNGPSITWIY